MSSEYKLSYTAADIDKKLGEIDNKLDANKLPEAIDTALAQAKESGQFDGAIASEEKTLILTLFRNAAYTANMSATFAQLESLWNGSGDSGGSGSGDTTVTLSSISVSYSGDDVPVGTAISALSGVSVIAHYSNGTSLAVTGYTLAGTIAEGSNTITVSYGGKSASFIVTGIAAPTQMEVLNTFKWRGSGWPTPTDNGDGSYAFDITAGQTVYDSIPSSGAWAYWTMIYPGNIHGGQLKVKFNKLVTGGNIGVVVYAVNKDCTLVYQVTNNWKWETDLSKQNITGISQESTLDIPVGLYPFIMVRNNQFLMDGDESSSNLNTANHINNGDITFEVTG